MGAKGHAAEVFAASLKLGLTSFGGPVAHLGYMHDEFVRRRRWLDDAAYADLVTLCQFLPGPASSQLGMAIGNARAGLAGGLAAWIGFTLPSALLMIGCGYGFQILAPPADSGWLHGLKLAAVAVVAQAVWVMGRQLCPDRRRIGLALGAALLVLMWPTAPAQILVLLLGALAGRVLLPGAGISGADYGQPAIGRRLSLAAWIVFFLLLAGLPFAAGQWRSPVLAVFDSCFRAGALVFGGGHVVLPMLRAELVPPGWVSDSTFLAGYGMAQALPGPVFTFAAYLGTVTHVPPGGWRGGVLALIAIFLPAFLLLLGALPHWNNWRRRPGLRSALEGVNAAVVGILLAALYNPVWVTAVHGVLDAGVAGSALALLMACRVRPLWVVAFAAATGAGMAALTG